MIVLNAELLRVLCLLKSHFLRKFTTWELCSHQPFIDVLKMSLLNLDHQVYLLSDASDFKLRAKKVAFDNTLHFYITQNPLPNAAVFFFLYVRSGLTKSYTLYMK